MPIPRPIASAEIPWQEFDDVPRFRTRYRHLTQAVLGDDYRIGVVIEELPPGCMSAPAHFHIFEEEHVFILEGSLTARIGGETFAMRAGDYACFPAGHKAAHNLVNEGGQPCRYLVAGEKNPDEIVVYPDSNKVLVRAVDRAILDLGARRDYWDGEDTGLAAGQRPAAPPSPAMKAAKPFPPIAADDVAWEETGIDAQFGGQAKHLTHAAVGANYRVGMLIEAPGPGQRLAPLHYHMREEEHALILEGEVTLLLGEERLKMRPGDYICFPAGEKTGHSFMNSGSGPCRYLMIGARDAADICVYPQSDKMALAALGDADSVFDMSARRRYWDGEAVGESA